MEPNQRHDLSVGEEKSEASFNFDLEIMESIAGSYRLNSTQRETFFVLIVKNNRVKDAAEFLGIKENTLSHRLGELCKIFGVSGGKNRLSNLRYRVLGMQLEFIKKDELLTKTIGNNFISNEDRLNIQLAAEIFAWIKKYQIMPTSDISFYLSEINNKEGIFKYRQERRESHHSNLQKESDINTLIEIIVNILKKNLTEEDEDR